MVPRLELYDIPTIPSPSSYNSLLDGGAYVI